MGKKGRKKMRERAERYVRKVSRMGFEAQLVELVGPRCPEFQPGCAACDMYEAWDLHAYGHVAKGLKETLNWMIEG